MLIISDTSPITNLIQIGYPPFRIDVLTSIDGVDFVDAYPNRNTFEIFGAKNSSKSAENEQKCWALIDKCEIINTNLLVSEEYSTIRKELKLKGRPIPENDIWIAAACRANKLPLATRDKHI